MACGARGDLHEALDAFPTVIKRHLTPWSGILDSSIIFSSVSRFWHLCPLDHNDDSPVPGRLSSSVGLEVSDPILGLVALGWANPAK